MVNPDGFLMIEPRGYDAPPIVDSITRKVAYLNHRKENLEGIWYRGFHTCACDACSDNGDWSIKIGGKTYQTNSLIVHYVACHRSSIPPDQLKLIESLTEEEDPTTEDLNIQGAEERDRRLNLARSQSSIRRWAHKNGFNVALGEEVTEQIR
jgi:hypothetical protein